MTTATPIRMAHETIDRPALFLAVALGANQWKLGFTTGAAQRPRERNVPARHSEAVREESRKAKERFGLPADAPVISGDEAGRDGCWLHRWFVPQGVANGVVDSSSIAVNRRHRRAQTARLDGQKLAHDAPAPRRGGTAGMAYRPGPQGGGRRPPPVAPRLHDCETGSDAGHQPHQRAARVARPGEAPRRGLPPAVGAPPPVGRHPASGGPPPPSQSGVGARCGVGRSAWPRWKPNAARCSRRLRMPSRKKCSNG